MVDGPAGNLIPNKERSYPMKNIDLAAKYDKIYCASAYKSYFTFNQHAAERLIMDAIPNWTGLKVLDIGCGEGSLVAMMSFAGANNVEAINLAKSRIKISNVNFVCSDYKDMNEKYDVVVMNGV